MKKKSKKQARELKTETVSEYLARGGQIEVIPTEVIEEKLPRIGKLNHGPPNLMTLAEGAFWFSEKKKRRTKKKEQNFSKVDMSLLPNELKEQLGLNDAKAESTKEQSQINKEEQRATGSEGSKASDSQ